MVATSTDFEFGATVGAGTVAGTSLACASSNVSPFANKQSQCLHLYVHFHAACLFIKLVADYPALSVDRAGGGNPLYAEDTPNQVFLIWCAPIQEFLNWCVTNQDQPL